MNCEFECEFESGSNTILSVIGTGSVLFVELHYAARGELNGLNSPGLEVIKLEIILKLKIKRNDWLPADTCPQAANHCSLS